MVSWFDTVDLAPRLAVLHAHLFGWGSAMLNFNRTLTLACATVRRCFGRVAEQYFDDTGSFDLMDLRKRLRTKSMMPSGVFLTRPNKKNASAEAVLRGSPGLDRVS